MIRAILIVLMLSACAKVEFVRGCEVIADPIEYANCKLIGLTDKKR